MNAQRSPSLLARGAAPLPTMYHVHCMTKAHHYVWRKYALTLDQAAKFLLQCNGKTNRIHWFEPA